MNKLLTPDEVAELLGVEKSTIYQWTHQGFIPHVKLGRLIRFRRDKVDKWLQKKSVAGRSTKRISINDLTLSPVRRRAY
ncbi:MAG TPA: helix-turn-helix domain-containing protein [Acidobacteriota bacterium]|nr:helix-turn-helix domain-containing protein [Acidobacteriota bacterium]